MRTYQLNASLEEYIQGLQASVDEVGAILGRLGVGQRDLVYSFFRQQDPSQDEEDMGANAKSVAPQGNKGQAGSKHMIDCDGLVEYLHRLEVLLIGGVNVCGVYCVSSSIRAGEAAAQLSKVLSQFATEKGELDRLHDLPQTGGKLDGSLILHVDQASHKLVGKEYTAASSKQAAALKPCDIKFQDLAGHVVPLTCRHSIDLSFHVATSAESVSSQIQQHLGYEAQRIRTAIPTAEMNILRSSASVLQACTRGDAGPCNVDLLCTPSSSPSLKGGDLADATYDSPGRLSIRGSITARCLAFDREPFNAAAELLQDDLARSLEARAELMKAEADEAGAGHPLLGQAGSQDLELLMPQRAFFAVQEPWLQLSNHYFPGEGNAEVLATVAEISTSTLAINKIEWPEERSQGSGSNLPPGGLATSLGEGRPDVPFGLKTGKQALIIAIVICLISCLVSYLMARTQASVGP